VEKVGDLLLLFVGMFIFEQIVEYLRPNTNQTKKTVLDAPVGSNIGITRLDVMTDADVETAIKDSQKERHFLLFDTLIAEGETTIIAGPAGDGKTYTALEIPNSQYAKGVCYIGWDKRRKSQENRFLKATARKKIAVSHYEDKKALLEKIKSDVHTDSTIQAFGDTFLVPFGKLRERRNRYLQLHGMKIEKVVDEVLALEVLLSLPAVKDCNVVVIDTLNALLGHPAKFTRDYFNAVCDAVYGDGEVQRTLVILHHMDKTHKSMVGSEEIMNVPENVIFLTKSAGTERILTEKKAGNRPNKFRVTYNMNYVEDGKADIQLVSSEVIGDEDRDETGKPGRKPTLREPIIAFLKAKDKTCLDVLWEHLQTLGFANKRSVYTALEELERDGIICREGEGWGHIWLCESTVSNAADTLAGKPQL
jgi:hypothetical protein